MSLEAATCKIRRATLDDVPALLSLWKLMRFPESDFSKRVTEFQVAETPGGDLLGAVGFQIVDKQGHIYGESFLDFSDADVLRPLIWERLKSIANNHGLLRLWTQETARFWTHNGMARPDAETAAKLPPSLKMLPGEWLQLKLREDLETLMSVDKDFMLFMQSEKERSRRTMQHAKMLKVVATLIAVAVAGIAIAGLVLLVKKNPGFLRH